MTDILFEKTQKLPDKIMQNLKKSSKQKKYYKIIPASKKNDATSEEYSRTDKTMINPPQIPQTGKIMQNYAKSSVEATATRVNFPCRNRRPTGGFSSFWLVVLMGLKQDGTRRTIMKTKRAAGTSSVVILNRSTRRAQRSSSSHVEPIGSPG